MNKALLKENLKRYSLMSVLFFISFALIVLAPTALSEDPNSRASLMEMIILNNAHPYILIAMFLFPLCSALSIFSYLHNSAHMTVVQSLPISKSKQFITNYVSGFILCILPLVLLTICLFFGKYAYEKMPYMSSWYFEQLYQGTINTPGNILLFFAKTFIGYLLCYTLCVLAAVLSGAVFVQVLMSFLLIGLIPALYIIHILLSSYYLFGYATNQTIFMNTVRICIPMATGFGSLEEGAWRNAPYWIQLAASGAFTALGLFLYKIRRSERSGNSVVFSVLKIFFIYFGSVSLMLACTSLMLLIADNTIGFLYIYLLVFGVIGYFIMQMISEKTFNVFYKYKGLGVLLLISVSIISFYKYDFMDYEKKIPALEEIESASISNPFYWREPFSYRDEFITNDKVKANINQLHESFIDENKMEAEYYLNPRMRYYNRITINYKLKNGKEFIREFPIDPETFRDNELYKEIVDSRAYKKHAYARLIDAYQNNNMQSINNAQIMAVLAADDPFLKNTKKNEQRSSNINEYSEDPTLEKKEKVEFLGLGILSPQYYEEFFDVLMEDLLQKNTNDLKAMEICPGDYQIRIEINSQLPKEAGRGYYSQESSGYFINHEMIVNKSFTKTYAWLSQFYKDTWDDLRK